METNRKYDLTNKPTICSVCGAEVKYKGLGEYICVACGNVERDDFAKVRHFIDVHGPSSAIVISEGTGVPVSMINTFLKDGRVEIPEGSKVYITCESCGTEIRYGRYCSACATRLSNQLQGVFEAGAEPKKRTDADGKMHFLGRDTRRRK